MENEKILIEILGRVDALHWRFPVPNIQSAFNSIAERRNQYRVHGIPVTGGGADHDRKSLERSLNQLQDEGFIRISSYGSSRVSVRLTDLGDDQARFRTWVSRCYESFPLLKAIAKHPGNCGHVWEGFVAGVKPRSKDAKGKIIQLSEDVLVLMSRGWVTSWIDGDGVHGYGLTESGRVAMNGKAPATPENPDCDLETLERCCGWYEKSFDSEVENRLSWRSESGSVSVPLSCANWPGPDDGLSDADFAKKIDKEIARKQAAFVKKMQSNPPRKKSK